MIEIIGTKTGAATTGDGPQESRTTTVAAYGETGHAHEIHDSGGVTLHLYIGPDDWPALAASVQAQLDGMLSVLSSHMRAAHCDDALAAAVADYYGGE